MSDTDRRPTKEGRFRRTGWTSGVPVRLADENWWALPRLDLGLLITTASLRDDMARALQLARDARDEREGSRSELLSHVKYHMHMADVGIRLLQVNYDLPDEDWKSLLMFGGIKEMLLFTAEVSAMLSAACAELPLLAAAAPGGPDAPWLN